MEFVKLTRNGETITVEKGAVHLYAMDGWTVDKNESNSKNTYSTANTSYSYDKTNRQ